MSVRAKEESNLCLKIVSLLFFPILNYLLLKGLWHLNIALIEKLFLNHECFTTFDNTLLHYPKILHKIIPQR